GVKTAVGVVKCAPRQRQLGTAVGMNLRVSEGQAGQSQHALAVLSIVRAATTDNLKAGAV
ncbi:MAG: hypothetical protein LC739_04695, partial [Actinobacteria bacterium]|nr:hypothetical protein [Actinomycetota bacterium]